MTSKKLAATTIGIRLMVWSGPRQLTLTLDVEAGQAARARGSPRAPPLRCETWLPPPIRMCTSWSGRCADGIANISSWRG